MPYSNYLKERVKKFVSRYGKEIIEAITDSGMFFPAVVAQKCLESDYGDSKLASEHNNFGGIKNFGSLPNAGVVYMDTTEFKNGVRVVSKEPFASYPSVKIAFLDYIRLLKDPSKKYTSMGVFRAESPEEQITLLAKAGYTTTPPAMYLKSMQGIIDCVRDVYGFGKIESKPAADAVRVTPSTSLYGSASSLVTETLNSVLNNK